MGVGQFLKSQILIQLIVGYVFIVSGLIVSFLMLCSCVIWPFSRHLYRKITVHLAYAHWSQFTFLGQWWSGSEVLLYVKPEDYEHIGKEHVLVTMNHKYDIDWLMAWILSERFQMLGNTKIYGKQILKYVPLIGWAWYFTESIFLKRQWDHDKEVIRRDLKQATDYPPGYYVTLLLFPEGTRFTEEKHKASETICRQKGYPLLKHVLLPRPKGFITSVHGLKGHFPTILNCTVGFPPDGPAPTLMNIINGKPFLAHFYAERIPIDNVPTESDEACADWLRQLFKRKDDLYDHYLLNGKFPGDHVIVPKRTNDLVMWLFWTILLCVPLFVVLVKIFAVGAWYHQLLVVVIAILGSYATRWMITVSEIEKGSSYGKTNQDDSSKKAD